MSRWRVRVREANYGRRGVVFLTRSRFPWSYQEGIRVAVVDLTRDDAEEQLADARAKARLLVRSVSALEG